MVRSTTRLLGMAVLCLAASGCAYHNTQPKQEKTANVEPTLRQAALLAERNGSYGEAASHYAALRSRYPNDKAITLALARNLRFAGNPQQAIAVLNGSGVPQSGDAMSLLELGKDYLAADQLNLAKPTLERAKQSAPLNWEVLSTLGVVYDYEGLYDKAQEQYEAALFVDPENATVLNNKALSLAQEGDLDQALKVMQLAIDQPEASAQTRQNLALLMALKGDADAAERLVRKDLPSSVADANIAYYRSIATETPTAAPAAVATPAPTAKPALKPAANPAAVPDLPAPPPPLE
jgi:Flp pilus assembly protein TadD